MKRMHCLIIAASLLAGTALADHPAIGFKVFRTADVKQILSTAPGVTIVDDNQWEPDEEFFVKLTLIPGPECDLVRLGKTCIMEITILNDDGESRD